MPYGLFVAVVTVLVVEDNEKNLKLVRDLLEHHGAAVVAATTAAEALRVAPGCGAGVALVDIDLPDANGAELLGPLRAALPGVAIAAVTAYAMKGDRERLLDAGFDAYVPKPIDVATFAATVFALAER